MAYQGKLINGLIAEYLSENATFHCEYGDGRSNLLMAVLRYISLKYKEVPNNKISLIVESSFDLDFINNFAYKGDGAIFIAYAPYSEIKHGNKIPEFCSKDKGWISLNGEDEENPCLITNYIIGAVRSGQCAVKIYVNKETHTVIAFSNLITTSMIDAFTSILPKILLWIYPEDLNTLDGEEKSLFAAISKSDIATATSILDGFVDGLNIGEEIVKTRLHGWNNKFVDEQIADVTNQIKDANAKEMLSSAVTAVSDVVKQVYQTYVEALKGQNAFTAEAQKEALAKALETIEAILPEKVKAYLTDNFGNMEAWLTTQIEAAIYSLKNGQKVINA